MILIVAIFYVLKKNIFYMLLRFIETTKPSCDHSLLVMKNCIQEKV